MISAASASVSSRTCAWSTSIGGSHDLPTTSKAGQSSGCVWGVAGKSASRSASWTPHPADLDRPDDAPTDDAADRSAEHRTWCAGPNFCSHTDIPTRQPVRPNHVPRYPRRPRRDTRSRRVWLQ